MKRSAWSWELKLGMIQEIGRCSTGKGIMPWTSPSNHPCTISMNSPLCSAQALDEVLFASEHVHGMVEGLALKEDSLVLLLSNTIQDGKFFHSLGLAFQTVTHSLLGRRPINSPVRILWIYPSSSLAPSCWTCCEGIIHRIIAGVIEVKRPGHISIHVLTLPLLAV